MTSKDLAMRERPENRHGIVRQVLEAIRHVAYGASTGEEDGKDVAASLIDERVTEGTRHLYEWRSALGSLMRGAFILKDELDRALIRDLGHDAVRFDDRLLRVDVEPPDRRIKDQEGLVAYLELSAGALLAFPPSCLSVAGLRKYAEARGDNPDEVVERYIDWVGEEGKPFLRMGGMQYAPYWALDMAEGERRTAPPREGRTYE